MAQPGISSNLGDPDNFEGLPYAGSPVTAAGLDPDEVRMMMAGGGGADQLTQRIQAAQQRTPPLQMKPDTTAMPTPAPASPYQGAGRQTVGVTGAPGGVASAPAPRMPAPETQPAGWTSDTAQQGAGMQLQAGEKLLDTARAMQADPEIPRLQEQVVADQAATPNPRDYKPGWGTRILRGLKGAALGAATGGIFGAAAGALDPALVRGGTAYGAPTDAYDTALDANRRQTEQDQQRLADAAANFKQAQDMRVAQETALKDASAAGKGAGETATGLSTANTKAAEVPIDQQKADAETQKAFNVSAEGKVQATQAEIDQRTKFADQAGMPQGFRRWRYILTGQMQEQAQRAPSPEETNLNTLVAAFRGEHGGQGPKTVADWQGLIQAARGTEPRAGGGGEKADAIVSKAVADKDAFLSQWERQKDGYWTKRGTMYAGGGLAKNPADVMTGQQMQARLDKFRTDANVRLAPLGVTMDQGGNVVSAAAAQAPPVQPGDGQAGRVNATSAPASGQRVNQPAPAAAAAAAQGARQGQPPRFNPGPDGMVRMKLPDGRIAKFPAKNAAQAWSLGAEPI